jgi:hypothetical protein
MNVLGALSAGHSVQQILNYISRAFPELGEGVSDALKAGKSADEILKFISKIDTKQLARMRGKRPGKKVFPEVEDANPYLAAQEATKNFNPIPESAQTLGKAALGAAGLAGTGALASKALQAALSRVGTLLGRGFSGLGAAAGESAESGLMSAIGALKKGLPKTDIKDLLANFNNLNLTPKIEKLAASNPPEIIGGLLQKIVKPEDKQALEAKFEKPFGELVKEYGDYYLRKGEEKPLSRDALMQQFNIAQLQREEPSKPEKGELAALPNGDIGEIESISGHSALVNVNGKIKNIPLADLQAEPETVKNAKIVFDPTQIPEELKSAALTYVIAPSSRNDVMISFGPSGKFYRYYRKDGKPVDEDIIKKLEEGTEMPMTSGSSYMGAWNADKADSRGTVATHELRDKAQKAGTVDNPVKEYWFEELDVPFMHGFYEEFNKILKTMSKKFEGPKKPRKKKNG